ncbi:MAG: SPOR domain-containing protein [Bacteroidia bacterium]
MRNFFSLMIFSLSFLLTLATPESGPGVVAFFNGSFEQMKTKAHEEQKPYLLSFHDDGIPSRNLERFTYSSPQLANYVANNYLAMQLSFDNSNDLTTQLVDRYQVILFPTIVLFSAEGKMLYRFTGFTGDQAFIQMLQTYRNQLQTDMSMTFPPESYKISTPPSLTKPLSGPAETKPESTALIFQDLNAENEPPIIQSEMEEFQITELNDLDNTKVLKHQSDELTQIEDIRPTAEATEISILDEKPANNNVSTPTPEIKIPVLPTSNLIVQTGVYADKINAQKEKTRLQQDYTDNVHIDQLNINGRNLYRVRIGPFTADSEAKNILKQYNTQERMNAIIKTLQN